MPPQAPGTVVVRTVDELRDFVTGESAGVTTAVVMPGTYKLKGEQLDVAASLNLTLQMADGFDAPVLDAGSLSRIFEVKGQLSLTGIVLRSGKAQMGGGIFLHSKASLTLQRVTIERCEAVAGGLSSGSALGGALYVGYESTATIDDSHILGCCATNNDLILGARAAGGGIYVLGFLTMTATKVLSCCANAGVADEGVGGGLYVEDGNVLLANATQTYPSLPGRASVSQDLSMHRNY